MGGMKRSGTDGVVAVTVILALAAAALTGCSSQPRVKAQVTPGTDFSKYRTYAIKPGNVVFPGAPDTERQDVIQKLQDAIAAEMESRGLEPQPDAPDLIVTYTVGANPQQVAARGKRAPVGVDIRDPGGNPYDEPGLVMPRELPDASADTEIRRYNVEANVIIDLLDGRSRRLVWRATSVIDLTPTRRARSIDRVVRKAFADLPLGLRGGASSAPTSAPTQPTQPSSAPSSNTR